MVITPQNYYFLANLPNLIQIALGELMGEIRCDNAVNLPKDVNGCEKYGQIACHVKNLFYLCTAFLREGCLAQLV